MGSLPPDMLKLRRRITACCGMCSPGTVEKTTDKLSTLMLAEQRRNRPTFVSAGSESPTNKTVLKNAFQSPLLSRLIGPERTCPSFSTTLRRSQRPYCILSEAGSYQTSVMIQPRDLFWQLEIHLDARHAPFDGCFTAGILSGGGSASRAVRTRAVFGQNHFLARTAIDDILPGSPPECVSNYCKPTVI